MPAVRATRARVLALAAALDPQRQGGQWPDPIRWDGRPLDEQMRDLLALATSHPDPSDDLVAAIREATAPTTQRRAALRVRVTDEQAAALERIAAADGATVSEVVRRLIAAEVAARA